MLREMIKNYTSFRSDCQFKQKIGGRVCRTAIVHKETRGKDSYLGFPGKPLYRLLLTKSAVNMFDGTSVFRLDNKNVEIKRILYYINRYVRLFSRPGGLRPGKKQERDGRDNTRFLQKKRKRKP